MSSETGQINSLLTRRTMLKASAAVTAGASLGMLSASATTNQNAGLGMAEEPLPFQVGQFLLWLNLASAAPQLRIAHVRSDAIYCAKLHHSNDKRCIFCNGAEWQQSLKTGSAISNVLKIPKLLRSVSAKK